MRLICPNCSAQYEVADDVIPATGRDVQCSNCGHTWFEEAVHADPAGGADTRAEEAKGDPWGGWNAEPDRDADTPDLPEDVYDEAYAQDAPTPGLWLDPHDNAASGSGAPAAVAPARPPAAGTIPPHVGPVRRTISPEIADILREEAAREEAVRKAESGVIESQPELGLDQGEGRDRPGAAARRDSDRPQPAGTGTEADAKQGTGTTGAAASQAEHQPEHGPDGAAAAVADEPDALPQGARRERLPDIDEINSTLRPTSERTEPHDQPHDATPERRRRSGFRLGFATVVLIAVALWTTYAYAPDLAEAVPAAAAPLADYVDSVDAGRIWLDQRMQDLSSRLNEAGRG